MANLKEVRNRIASTQSTQQITKAMKMVSATKLRKAQQAITQMRPYADKLNGILMNLADSAKDEQELQGYFEHRELKNVLLIVNSSDRGLCGGFNSSVIKEVLRHVKVTYPGKDIEILAIGKKGNDLLSKQFNVIENRSDIFDHLTFDNVAIIAQKVMDLYVDGSYDLSLIHI